LAEHGVVAPQGPANLKGLAEAIGSETTPLPLLVVELSRVFLDQIDGLSKTIAELEKATVQEDNARSDDASPATHAGRGTDHRDGD
jgi:transposase